jgi:hypothetical protein
MFSGVTGLCGAIGAGGTVITTASCSDSVDGIIGMQGVGIRRGAMIRAHIMPMTARSDVRL